MKKTIPIIFNGGAYGTYLEWCLTTLTTDIDIVSPGAKDGSNHNFEGNHLLDMAGWNKYVVSKQCFPFVRFHPKTLKEESLVSNLQKIRSEVDKTIMLYPDSNTVLLNVNNIFSKISNEWWPAPMTLTVQEKIEQQNILGDLIYQNWPVDRSVPFQDIPVWIKREFLSLYLMPAWMDQVEWFLPDHWSDSECCIVYIQDLLYDFENTLTRLKIFLNLEYKKNISQLIPVHNAMLSNQINLHQDSLCNQIIKSTLDKIEFDWQDLFLTLPSESWIQWQLRNLGFEIKCHGLDTFPTNSVNLQKLIYKI